MVRLSLSLCVTHTRTHTSPSVGSMLVGRKEGEVVGERGGMGGRSIPVFFCLFVLFFVVIIKNIKIILMCV